jgi:type II secretory pathway pseudopilin PulG
METTKHWLVRRRRASAFTLTELVFSLMVLAVGMVPVMCMLIVSQRVSQQAQIQRIAYNVARYQLERVTSESFTNCSSTLSNCNTVSETGFTIPASLTGTIPRGVTLTGTYAIAATSSTTVRQVSVLVRWSSTMGNSTTNNPNSEVRLSTLVTQQPGP